jgi:hypothetical protein
MFEAVNVQQFGTGPLFADGYGYRLKYYLFFQSINAWGRLNNSGNFYSLCIFPFLSIRDPA